jgi:hypothetical protein
VIATCTFTAFGAFCNSPTRMACFLGGRRTCRAQGFNGDDLGIRLSQNVTFIEG